jgi:PAS domain S-box-containing protein
MAGLGALFGGDDAQAAHHLRLSERIARKRLTMERSIDLREAGRPDAAFAAVSSGDGKAAMDEIRRVVDQMTTREAQQLSALSEGAATRTERTEIMVVLLFAALVLIAGGTAFLVWRYLTTRGALQERLEAAAARHSATLDSAFDAIVTLNPSGTIETMNSAAERMFGRRSEEIGRRDVSALIDLAANGEGTFLDRLGASQGALDDGLLRELIGKRRDGETFPADVALGAMDLPTGRHVVAVIRDITERRRVAEVKDAFVSTVSHELRTPLTSIAGSLGLLAAGAGGTFRTRRRG